jgi:hypothetical protein
MHVKDPDTLQTSEAYWFKSTAQSRSSEVDSPSAIQEIPRLP